MGKGYTLSSPAVKQARASFLRDKAKKEGRCPVTFEFLFREFGNPDASMSVIAEKARVGRKVLVRIYEAYFLEFFGARLPLERQLDMVKRRKDSRIEELRHTLPETPWMEKLKEHVDQFGYSLQAHLILDQHSLVKCVSQTTVEISGVICRVYPFTKKYKPASTHVREYSRVLISRSALEGIDACVFLPMLPTCYSGLPLIQATILEQQLLANGQQSATLNFPHQPIPNSRKVRLDPWKFTGTWRSLPQLKQM